MAVTLIGKTLQNIQNCKPHSHRMWEIILNLEGNGVDSIGDQVFPFSPGSIVCIPPRMAHSKTADGRFLDIFMQCTDFFITDERKPLVFQDENYEVEMLMQLIHQLFHQDEHRQREAIQALEDSIQYILLAKSERTFLHKPVSRLVQKMIENISNPEFLPSQSIMELPYSGDYLRRLFREDTGMTPVGYLHMLRVKQAQRLMKQQPVTARSVSEIALMCGYYDPKYFTRMFRKLTNRSPKEYAAGL